MKYFAGRVLCGALLFAASAVAGEWPTAPVAATGQTICYDSAGSIVSCDGSGQDGQYRSGVAVPGPRFIDNADGTVTDRLTGLMWLKNANCAGADRSWGTALADVDQLNADGTMNGNSCGDTSNAGSHQTDWRLPNIVEYLSIVDYAYCSIAVSNCAGTGQAVEDDPFSGINGSGHWSSTTWAGAPENAFYFLISSGAATSSGKTNSKRVWAVRNAQISAGLGWPQASPPQTGQVLCYDASGAVISCAGTGQDGEIRAGVPLPTPRFADNGDGTVTDILTGLIWLKKADCGDAFVNWDTALGHIVQLNTSGSINGNSCGDTSNGGTHQSDWRLPSLRDQLSLINFAYNMPAFSNIAGDAQGVEGDPFLSASGKSFFSSTSYACFTDQSWTGNTVQGGAYQMPKINSLFVWAVRGGPVFADGFATGSTDQWGTGSALNLPSD